MSLIQKRYATRGDLKWFGLLMGAFFGLMGTMSWMRTHHKAAITFWCIGAGLMLAYYLVRSIQRPVFDLWMGISYPIGWVMSAIMMAVIFFLVLTPVGLVMRLLGRDPMCRAFDRAAESYWEPHNPEGDSRRYFQQF
jgi:saxitoxin biosynthesis operon SxtJ-like protein